MKSVSNFNISYIISYKNVNYVGSKSISRVLSWIIICLGLLSPISSSEQPYWTVPSRHPTVPFVLAPDGVYIAYLSLDSWWALTSPFQPYQLSWRYTFCCTCLKITPTWRYQASLLCGARTFLVKLIPRLPDLLHIDFTFFHLILQTNKIS